MASFVVVGAPGRVKMADRAFVVVGCSVVVVVEVGYIVVDVVVYCCWKNRFFVGVHTH